MAFNTPPLPVASSLACLWSVLMNYLITSSLEKYIIVLEKIVGKVLNFGFKNLY